MSKHDYFDKQVQQKLEGHEAPVPVDAWANIQKGRRRKRPLIWHWLFAALLLGGGTALYHYHSDKNIKDNTETIASTQKNKPAHNDNSKAEMPADTNSSDTTQLINRKLPDDNSKVASPLKSITTDNKNGIVSAVDKPKDINKIVPVNNNSISRNNVSNNHQQYYIKKDKKENTVNVVKHVYADKAAQQDDVSISNTKKIKITQAGKTNMQVQVPDSETDKEGPAIVSSNTPTVSEKQDEIIDILNNKDSVATALQNQIKDSVIPALVITKTAHKQDKKAKTFGIDIGFSVFAPFGKYAGIATVNRTIITALNKAEFTADKVRIRLQPATGFSVQLFKNTSAKTTVAAGLSYTMVKEYIDLSGEETNTDLVVVKRLQNGNALVNDTVTTVTKGIRNINAVNSYSFLSIPVSIRYQVLQQQQWRLDVQAGIDINLQTKYRNSIEGALVPQFVNANVANRNQSIGAGFNTGMRLSRKMGKNYWLYAAPYIQFYPKKLYLNEMLAPRNMHRAGISFGVNYKF